MREEPEKDGQQIKLLKEPKLWKMKSEEQIIEALKAFTGNSRKIIVSGWAKCECRKLKSQNVRIRVGRVGYEYG